MSVTSPAGGEAWKVASSHAITWTATDNVGVTAVDLAYSTDGGATYPNAIATSLANSGSYAWTVPNTPSTTVRVRATARDAAGNAGTGASAANFTIDRWTITASAGGGGTISPSGTVYVAQGGSQTGPLLIRMAFKLRGKAVQREDERRRALLQQLRQCRMIGSEKTRKARFMPVMVKRVAGDRMAIAGNRYRRRLMFLPVEIADKPTDIAEKGGISRLSSHQMRDPGHANIDGHMLVQQRRSDAKLDVIRNAVRCMIADDQDAVRLGFADQLECLDHRSTVGSSHQSGRAAAMDAAAASRNLPVANRPKQVAPDPDMRTRFAPVCAFSSARTRKFR